MYNSRHGICFLDISLALKYLVTTNNKYTIYIIAIFGNILVYLNNVTTHYYMSNLSVMIMSLRKRDFLTNSVDESIRRVLFLNAAKKQMEPQQRAKNCFSVLLWMQLLVALVCSLICSLLSFKWIVHPKIKITPMIYSSLPKCISLSSFRWI